MRVIIIGAGLLGVTSAYFLARRGHEVDILERREAPGLETSFANSGMVTPSQADPWNSPDSLRRLLTSITDRDSPLSFKPGVIVPILWWSLLFLRNSSPARFRASLVSNAALANYSLEIFQRIRADTGIHYDHLPHGTLKLYREQRAFERAIRLSEDLSSLRVNHRVLDVAAVTAQEPALADAADRLVGGVYYPDDESGDAHLFCRGLGTQASAAGARFHYGADVRSIERRGNEVVSVKTRSGEFRGDAYVIAAGSYSTRLGKMAGIRVPVTPIKGYSVTLPEVDTKRGPRMPVIDDARHIAISPLGRRLRVAGMAEFAGYNADIRPERVARLVRFLGEVYPQVAEDYHPDTARLWAGLRPYCCDGMPLIGQAGPRNVYLNTGHGHLGWSLSAGSGKLLADHLCGEEEIDISPYRPQRL